jgi:integrase
LRIHPLEIKGQNAASRKKDGYVPLHPVLAGHLRAWRRQGSTREKRLCLSVDESQGKETGLLVCIRRRPSATGRKESRRTHRGRPTVGLYNLRHSLSHWLVNKANAQSKTVQELLRHAKIQTTLDLYTQEDSDETRAAQGKFLNAVGMSTAVK